MRALANYRQFRKCIISFTRLQTYFRHFQNLDLHDLRIYSRYTQPDPAGGDIPAHSMVLEWWGQLSSSFRSIQPASARDWNRWNPHDFLTIFSPLCISDVHFPQLWHRTNDVDAIWVEAGQVCNRSARTARMVKILRY